MLDSHFKGYSPIPQETAVWIPAGTSRLIKETGISSSELCKVKYHLLPKVSGLLQWKVKSLCWWNEWWHWSEWKLSRVTPAGPSLSGFLCLVTCFGFFALKFLNSHFFSSNCYFQMISTSFWSPFIAVVVSEKYVVWYIPMWKWIHFIVVLILHSILPPLKTLHCWWILSGFLWGFGFFLLKQIWENTNTTVGPIEASSLHMTWPNILFCFSSGNFPISKTTCLFYFKKRRGKQVEFAELISRC